MSVTGYQLTGSTVTAVADRKLYEYLSSKDSGVISGCAVTYSGATISVANGYGFAKGCFFDITAQTLSPTLPSSGTYNGYVVVNIDADNNTASLSAITGASPTLQQDDINGGGSLYQMPLASFTCNASAVTSLTEMFTTATSSADAMYPIGSVMTTSTNSAPSFGTWTLIGKKFAEQTITSGIISSWDSRVSGSTISAKLSGDFIRIDFSMVASSSSSSTVTGGVMNLSAIGVDSLPNFSFDTWYNGSLNTSTWHYVSGRSGKDFYTYSIPSSATYDGSVTIAVPSANKLDTFCDQFIWKRTA